MALVDAVSSILVPGVAKELLGVMEEMPTGEVVAIKQELKRLRENVVLS